MESFNKRLSAYFEAEDSQQHSKFLLSKLRQGESLWSLVGGHPYADDWLDWIYRTLPTYLKARQGAVYVAANPAWHVPVVKVGQTKGAAAVRVQRLRTAGVLGEFTLLMSTEVADRYYVESQVHAQLRVKYEHDRELFRAPADEVMRILTAVADKEAAWLRASGFSWVR